MFIANMKNKKKGSIFLWSMFFVFLLSMSFMYLSVKIQTYIERENSLSETPSNIREEKLWEDTLYLKYGNEKIIEVTSPQQIYFEVLVGSVVEYSVFSWWMFLSSWIIKEWLSVNVDQKIALHNFWWITQLQMNVSNQSDIIQSNQYIKKIKKIWNAEYMYDIIK